MLLVLLVLESVWEFETAGFFVLSNLWEWIPSPGEEYGGFLPAESPDASDVCVGTECTSDLWDRHLSLSFVLVQVSCSTVDKRESSSRQMTRSFAGK